VEQTIVVALLDAYNRLQEIIFDLYAEYEKAMQNQNYADASLLEARAERLFEEAESIILVIREQTNG
jgi:superfamily I DNA/RNA helicase